MCHQHIVKFPKIFRSSPFYLLFRKQTDCLFIELKLIFSLSKQTMSLRVSILQSTDAIFIILIDLLVYLNSLSSLWNHLLQHSLLADQFLEFRLFHCNYLGCYSFLLQDLLSFLWKPLFYLIVQLIRIFRLLQKFITII